MQLNDNDIAFHQLVEPFRQEQLQPATYDLTLGDEFIVYIDWHNNRAIDPTKGVEEGLDYNKLHNWDQFELQPQEFILGTTVEKLKLPSTIAGRIEGKSSLGRIGLLVHSTAGFIDPGFEGQVTLELCNINKMPIVLTAGMRIAQISFTRLTSPAFRTYGQAGLGSHYQGQKGVQAADFT